MNENIPALPTELLESATDDICKHYRIDPETARKIVADTFARRPDLLQKIAERSPRQDVTRFAGYKEALKEARKQVYYHLRQYHRDREQETQLKTKLASLVQASASLAEIQQVIDELLRTHVSTQERFDHYPAFYRGLFALVPPAFTIIDIGCGIHPLSYPFRGEGQHTRLYVAIDKDAQAIDMLTTFALYVAPARLVPLCANIASFKQEDYSVNGVDRYDLALMLKLIPVIARQQKALLPMLAQVPARQIVLTASTTAMTRDEAIARREDRTLQQFIQMTGRPLLHTFSIENEFGYVLGERNDLSAL